MNHEINDCRPSAGLVSSRAKCNSRAKIVYKGFFHKAYCLGKHRTQGGIR